MHPSTQHWLAIKLYYISTHTLQGCTASFTYDYARDEFNLASPVNCDGHYEMDSANEEPFWEPASAEEELKKQLQDITMSEDDLR